jgi:peptide/nickel transport system permease protein
MAFPAAEAVTGWRTRSRRLTSLPKLALVGIVIVGFFVLAAAAAPLIAPHNPNTTDLLHGYFAPSSAHLLGQDGSGRDVLSRLIYGARLSLLGPLLVVLLATLVGVPLGVAAGYLGGVIDSILSRIFDVAFAFPPLLLATIIVATYGLGFQSAVIAVGITYIPLLGRIVRAGALSERERPYIQACRAQGYSALRICVLHLGPNLSRLILSQVALYFGYSLLDLAALSFLGLGTQPPTADWGTMLSEASQGIFLQPWGVLPASVCIVIVVVGFNLIADGISERARIR